MDGFQTSLFFPAFPAHQISQKKLKKFEKEYHTLREQQEQQEAPIERYEVDEGIWYSHGHITNISSWNQHKPYVKFYTCITMEQWIHQHTGRFSTEVNKSCVHCVDLASPCSWMKNCMLLKKPLTVHTISHCRGNRLLGYSTRSSFTDIEPLQFHHASK